MAHHIFISHSTADDPFVAELCGACSPALAEDLALGYDDAAEVELLLEALGQE